MKRNVIFSWSSGKDSAFALYKLLENPDYKILSLITMFSEYNRVGFHGVSRDLVQRQADSIGISLSTPTIDSCEDLEEYALKLEKVLTFYPLNGFKTIAYGDIFLEDLRKYRLKILAKLGMQALFPIWKNNTTKIINEFINLGFKAIVVCIDSKVLDKSFVGRIIDQDFIKDLPENVDPCGENGEFHTFVFNGPIFQKPVNFKIGEIVLRNNFYYCDLLSEEQLEIDDDLALFIKEENIEKIKTLEPLMQKEVINLYKECEKIKLHFEIVSARRTFEEDVELYNNYHKKYPNQIGFPGNGSHERGIAIDIKIGESNSYSPKYDKIAKVWKEKGHYWGQDFNDEYWHFAINNNNNKEVASK